jgi:hypothetical protein
VPAIFLGDAEIPFSVADMEPTSDEELQAEGFPFYSLSAASEEVRSHSSASSRASPAGSRDGMVDEAVPS